jgi:hypothetical protein
VQGAVGRDAARWQRGYIEDNRSHICIVLLGCGDVIVDGEAVQPAAILYGESARGKHYYGETRS